MSSYSAFRKRFELGGAKQAVSGLLEEADHLHEIARRTAVSAEQSRRLDPAFIQALRSSGLAAVALPVALGGRGADVPTLLEAIRRIARGDGSAGWVAMIYASSSLAAHYLEPRAVREVFAEGTATLSSGVLAPRGMAQVVDGGYVVSGRWPFASGSLDASWISLGAVVEGKGAESGGLLNFYLPMPQVEIIDTWDVIGLRATGSHDVVVTEQQVPAHLSFDLTQVPRTDEPIARFPIYGLLAACIGAVVAWHRQGRDRRGTRAGRGQGSHRLEAPAGRSSGLSRGAGPCGVAGGISKLVPLREVRSLRWSRQHDRPSSCPDGCH